MPSEMLSCDSIHESSIWTLPSCEESHTWYSRLDIVYTVFRWCWKNWEVIWRQIIQLRLDLDDGRLSFWLCLHAQGARGAPNDRSCLGGEWTRPPWCRWLNSSSGWVYPGGMLPRPGQKFVAQKLAPLPSLLETDKLSYCDKSACWNSCGRLCRPGKWADPGESGRWREWMRWARIAHRWLIGWCGHVLLLRDWSRRTWIFP